MIPVLFESDDLLAVNKPEGLASIPEGDKGRDCLLSLLESAGTGRLYIVHRLDKEVSGVILFAKNAAAHKHLNEQFRQRNVRKTYVALTHGGRCSRACCPTSFPWCQATPSPPTMSRPARWAATSTT